MNRRIVIPEGVVAPHEHDIDQSLHDAIAVAMGERKVRLTDRRLLIMYVAIVLIGAFFLWRQAETHHRLADAQRQAAVTESQLATQQQQSDQRFVVLQRALHVNCDQEQFIVDKANSFYLMQIEAVNRRTDLTPVDKDLLRRNYEGALFPSLRCDLLPGGP